MTLDNRDATKTQINDIENILDFVKICRTENDVPYIEATNYHDLGFGYGYVHAQDRLGELIAHVIAMRGERSKYYGAENFSTIGFLKTTNLNSDLMFKVRVPNEWVQEEFNKLDTNTQNYIKGVTSGINYYIDNLSHAQREEFLKTDPLVVVKPADVVRSTMRFGVMKELIEIGPSILSSTLAYSRAPSLDSSTSPHAKPVEEEGGFGSNAWAFGSDVLDGETSILLGNPHSAWKRNPHQLRIYMHQYHLTIPGELDVSGASFLGFPFPLTGYNADVSWSILDAATVTSFVMQKMVVDTSKPVPTYLMDGQQIEASIQSVSVEQLESNGATVTKTYEFINSELGILYKIPEQTGKPAGWYAITNAGERNAKGLDQFLCAAKSGSTREFVDAIEQNRGVMCQLVVADKYGEVAYVIGGNVPPITDDQMTKSHLGIDGAAFNVLDGTRRENSYRDADNRPLVASPSFYPTIITRGIIQNTNNSYKYTEYGKVQPDRSSLFGQHKSRSNLKAPVAAKLKYDPRLIMSTQRLHELTADGSITTAQALNIVFDNRNYAAETFLDRILDLEIEQTDADIQHGLNVLKSWDRKNNAESKGALLFHQVWSKIVQSGLVSTSPCGNPLLGSTLLLDNQSQKIILKAIYTSITELKKLGFALDTAWGEVLYQIADKHKIPMHGGSYEQGILNGEMPAALNENGFEYVLFGTAYLQLTTWCDGKVSAKVLLSHGQKEGSDSNSRTNQLKMFLNKQLYRAPYFPAELEAATTIDSLVFQTSALSH